MKKVILIAIAILLPSVKIFSQWSQISTIITPQLNAVKFFNESTGITVGQGGIWRTTNSGVNWVQVLSGVNLNSVAFYNVTDGMAVGDSGKIVKTNDNGLSWQTLNAVTANNLNSIALCNPSDDFASYFSYVVGQNGIFLRSFNSGSSWSIGSAYTQDLYSIWIMNPGTGAGFTTGASNSETYFTTANGGTYWQPILNTTNGGYHLYAGAYISSQTCVCVGSGGRIRRTTNWGLNWSYPVSNTTNNLYSVVFIDNNTGWLCGENSFIERSTNSGLNWVPQFVPSYSHLRAISFINAQTGWVIGNNGIVLKTNNGGITSVSTVNSEIPNKSKLYQNFPNPFNPNTKIRFDIPGESTRNGNSLVVLTIYDIQGNEIRTLINEELNPGAYEVDLDMSNCSSGFYIYRIKVQNGYDPNNNFIMSKKLIVLK